MLKNQQRKEINKMKNVIELVALENGVTADEVRKEIQSTISLAMENCDPDARKFWDSISPDGSAPDAETLIAVIAGLARTIAP